MAKVISVRQPWAWLIAHGYKDVENRSWPTKYRGPIYIHAAKGMTHEEYWDAVAFAQKIDPLIKVPPIKELERGGIVGSAELIDCTKTQSSPWHIDGCYGFYLKNAQPLSFVPMKGQLGIFEIDEEKLNNEQK